MIEDAPATIGRYEVLAVLGQGGMARVYLAALRDAGTSSRLVVVKQIRPELASRQELRRMFADEARIAARLDHPNVVATQEIIEEGGQVSLVMEYLEGRTLAELLSRVGRPQFPFEESLWILIQVLAGLHYGHELRDPDGSPLGVIHQDVSPSNVFVTYDGEVKLLDFGIAKAVGALAATHKGSNKGKLGYAAPERFLARDVDARADVFAVGVMLWEAIAGRRRSNGETASSTREARLAGLESKIRDVRPDVEPELEAIVERATAVDPHARYASAAELQEALEAHLATRERPAGQREVAALLWVHFRSERLQTRTQIEERLAGIAPAPAPEPPPRRTTGSSLIMPTLTLRLQRPPRAMIAAAIIAAAGIVGVVVGLIRGPSRTEEDPALVGGTAVHSVVLERMPSDRPRSTVMIEVPPIPASAMHSDPQPVPLPLAAPERLRPRARPGATRARLADRNAAPREEREAVTPERIRPVEPGMDLTHTPERPPSHRQLDEKDPYSP
jgi:serine/threonine protein kinase